MSYLNKTTLLDFDEAYKYGDTLTLEEINRFDKLIKKVEKEFGSDNVITRRLKEIRENYL